MGHTYQAVTPGQGLVAGFRHDAVMARGKDHKNGNEYETFWPGGPLKRIKVVVSH